MNRHQGGLLSVFFGAWFVWLLVVLAFWGVIGYVVWHFVSKFW